MKSFVHQSDINELAKELTSQFEFNLTSRSPIAEIADRAQELLLDNGFPDRRSLAIVIAKKAKALWVGRIHSTKNQIL